MAKHVEVRVSCDNSACKGGTKGEKLEEFTVYNSKFKPVILDLHPSCHAHIYGPGLELADEMGQALDKDKSAKPKPPSAQPGIERFCLLCSETRNSDSGLLNHMHDEHGLPRSNAEIFGTVCPIDGKETPRLAMHVAQQHKADGHLHISQAFRWAKNNGDPHGVVADRITAMEKVAANAA